eukprot:3482593-Amphidinium_carterae.1
MAGKRSNKWVIVAFVVCATCWMVAWPTLCFMQQRHLVSNCRKIKICRQTKSAEQNAKALPELPLGVEDFDRFRTRKPSYAYVDKIECLVQLVADGRQHFLARPRRFDAIFNGLVMTKSDEGKNLPKQKLPVVFLKLNKCVAIEGKEKLINAINRRLIKETKRNEVAEEHQTNSSETQNQQTKGVQT